MRGASNSSMHSVSPQDVIAIAIQKWGSMDGLQQQRARKKTVRKEKLVYKKYAKIEAAKQKALEWEASAEGQAQLAQEAKHSEEAAAVIPGGSDRRKLLLDTLTACGLKLRLDSRLCNAYIRTGVGNPDSISDTMSDMKWLFDNTDYSWRSAQVGLSKAFVLACYSSIKITAAVTLKNAGVQHFITLKYASVWQMKSCLSI